MTRQIRRLSASSLSMLSKTDPFRRGINLFLGRKSSDLCPVMAILNYLVVRGPREGPLLMFSDGCLLTRQQLVEVVRWALGKAGLDPSKYCGHNFCIGAATAAAEKGMEDCHQNPWKVAEPSVSGVYPHPERTIGTVFKIVVFMISNCGCLYPAIGVVRGSNYYQQKRGGAW